MAAETNQWTKPTSGKWHESAWSLGRLPGASQSVEIVSTGSKTVEINSETVANHPTSLAIQNLLVTRENTLLLNAQTEHPLLIRSETNVWDGLTLSAGGMLVNLGMNLNIGGAKPNLLRIDGGRLNQSGGSVTAHTTYIHGYGQYHLTNGLFAAEFLDLPAGGAFNQYGGRATIGSVQILYSSNSLAGGELLVGDALRVSDSGLFSQTAGTNRVSNLSVGPNSSGGGRYHLSGGLLCTSNTFVAAFMSSSEFNQSRGAHVITNKLTLQGSARYYPPQYIPGRYTLSGGKLTVPRIEMHGHLGTAEYIQTGGSASVAVSIQLNVSQGYDRGFIRLEGGSISASNISHAGAGVDIFQTAGELIVTNLFSFGGFVPPPYEGLHTRIARYEFNGGTFTANEIELSGEWVIGSSSTVGRITNLGSFTMAGTLRVGHANERLGRFVLSSNAVIDLAPGAAKLAFANSSFENWNSEASLTVTNWSGSRTGNDEDQLKFGNNASGLTQQQLGRIRFANPAGLPPGEYPATILDSGEIVPPAPLHVSLILDTSASPPILRWPDNYQLQSSTNPAGPYEDFRNRTSPYPIEPIHPQRFYRLRIRRNRINSRLSTSRQSELHSLQP